jgi:D-alanyl-lipoteichoic acid acyltransferase DltB (MBOAT superfamily)
MLFNSLQFALFLPLVFTVHWTLPHRGRIVFLLIASYLFYGWWDPRFLTLIAISTLVDYFVARALETTADERRRRLVFLMSIVANLGILGFFKYSGFFVQSAADLLNSLGVEANPAFLRVVLPVGISFYTFQTMSYTFDVFRRRIPAERDLLSFALFVSYFPQLVAGPIERAGRLLPQIKAERDFPSWERIASGLVLIGLGLFKKVAIADVMAPIANAAFANPSSQSSLALLVGVYAFALQIYGDFSGYTDIARGASRLFGIELMRNFEQPYLSRNITEFWRTWHVSLSSWLHDYLYVPLGGNRKGPRRTYLNLMIVMVLGGLWHGAAWTFVVWGALHGIFLAVHRMLGHYSPRGFQGRFSFRRDVLRALLTFNLVCVAWVFFRAPSIESAWDYLSGLVAFRPGLPETSWIMLLVPAVVLILLFDLAQRNADDHDVILTWRPVAQGLVYATFLLGVVVFSGGPTIPFIYFQF